MNNYNEQRVVLSLNIARELIKRGFPVVDVMPSTQFRGRAAFIFDNTAEFMEVFSEIMRRSSREGVRH